MPELREFLRAAEQLGELKIVRGADWNLEIGAITEISALEPNPPALLFDDIKGYPSGYRLFTNMYQTQSRTALGLGLSSDLRGVELVRAVKDILRHGKPIPPAVENQGAIQENFYVGKDAKATIFPAPKLHQQDGGRYLGTCDAVITSDPETGWVNLATARVQILDEQRVSLYVSPGKQTRLIAQKYWDQGKSCPVALVCGLDPVLFAVSGLGLPWGMSEYDFAGQIQNSPVKVVRGEMTGLPIPASAEIVLEGEIPPPEVESEMEGPFGEWTGYYASGTRPAPLIRIKSVYHRKDPILTVLPDFKTYPLSSYLFLVFCAAGLWNEIEAAGLTDIRGVWCAEWGVRFFMVISVKQRARRRTSPWARVKAAIWGGLLFWSTTISIRRTCRMCCGRCRRAAIRRLLSRSPATAGAVPSIRAFRRRNELPVISPIRGRSLTPAGRLRGATSFPKCTPSTRFIVMRSRKSGAKCSVRASNKKRRAGCRLKIYVNSSKRSTKKGSWRKLRKKSTRSLRSGRFARPFMKKAGKRSCLKRCAVVPCRS
jgi:4-hydroxy-3-polyprenylbenzoate decarboxylase